MSLDDVKSRFIDEIKLRGYDDRYIDKNEEREILQIALQQGIGIDAARAALAQVCEQQAYVLESALWRFVQEQAEAVAGPGRKIDKAAFERIVQCAGQAAQGRRTDRDLKKMVVTIMEDGGMERVKSGWFTDWYAAVKRDVGMG